MVLVVLASCAGATAPVEPGVGAKATFVLANPGGLSALDDAGRLIGKIAMLPEQSAPTAPTLHPSGRTIAFALTGQPDPKRGFGSDIYTVGLDGKDLRAVLLHEQDNVFYASPRFDASGDVLYVHRRAAIIANGSFVGNEDTIERVDLRTGQRTRLAKDAADPTISPDGRTIVYVHLKDGQPESLWRVDIDGANAGPFLRTRDAFWYLQSPRFSPTGCELVFSAAGHTVAAAPGGTGAARASGGKLAHLNVPSEIFLAPCDGSGVRSVGQTGDDIVPAWSPDGTKVAYIGTGGLFVLEVKAQTTRTVASGQDFFFGDLVWLR